MAAAEQAAVAGPRSPNEEVAAEESKIESVEEPSEQKLKVEIEEGVGPGDAPKTNEASPDAQPQ